MTVIVTSTDDRLGGDGDDVDDGKDAGYRG